MQLPRELLDPTTPAWDAATEIGRVGPEVDPDGWSLPRLSGIRGETLADVLSRLASGDAETKQRFSRRKLLAAFTSICNVVH